MSLEEQPDPFLRPPWEPEEKRRNRLGYIVLLLAAAMLALIVGVLYFPGGEKHQGPTFPQGPGDRPLEQVSDLVFPADLLWQAPLTRTGPDGSVTPDSAIMPADVAVVDGRIFVLDTNNGRILEIDQAGTVLNVLDGERDSRLVLVLPMAMTPAGGKLYVANSGAGNIVVLNLDGSVDSVIVPQLPPAAKPLRPLGIAMGIDGSIIVSDPDNQRVIRLDVNGALLSSLGLGTRDSGNYGLNTPGGISVDAQGNIYVVDILNYAVKKYSPAGEFLASVGQAGDTEGMFSRPKVAVVDGGGRVFVSDTLLVAVEAFGTDGTYAGFIGRKDPGDKTSGSMFQAPHGMKVVGDTLYVIDRFAGLFAFRLPPQ